MTENLTVQPERLGVLASHHDMTTRRSMPPRASKLPLA